ncbi:MAG: hypothetical protein SGI72_08635 [Planctomycetota bacterium]|nr:hypothetical protein [Planctomycetota bacterium]
MDTLTREIPSARIPSRSALFRQLGWFGGGAALAVLVSLTRDMQAAPTTAGETAFWVVDRDAHRLYGLDRNLFVARAVPVDHPLEVEPVRDGGTWVLRSEDGLSGSSMRLDRLDPRGVVVTELYLESCRDLDTLDREQALVLENVNGSVRLSRVSEEGSLFPLLARVDLRCVSGSNGSILCGTDGGAVLRVDPASGAVLAELQLDGTIRDLAPGPTLGSTWALDTQGTGRVFLLDETLAVRWAAGVGFPCAHLGAVPGEERVWIADTSSPRVRRFGANAVVELDRQGLPSNNLDRSVPWRDGGVLLLSPSAIVHVGSDGNTLPGQGGFAWLSDAARVR